MSLLKFGFSRSKRTRDGDDEEAKRMRHGHGDENSGDETTAVFERASSIGTSNLGM
jgi:hypothetical protein